MAVGGVPYYLGYFKRDLSLAQNLDNLFFNKDAKLTNEFDRLFDAVLQLYRRYPKAYILS